MKSQQSHLHQAEASAALTRNRQTALCTELYTCNLVHIIQQKYLHRPVLSIEHDSVNTICWACIQWTAWCNLHRRFSVFHQPPYGCPRLVGCWMTVELVGTLHGTCWIFFALLRHFGKPGMVFVQDWFNGYATGVAPRLGPKYIFSIQYWSCHLKKKNKKKMLKNTGA